VERRLRVFENKVLRGILGPGRVVVKSEWRKLYNVELNDLGGPVGKSPFGRLSRRREDNIKMDVQDVGYEGM